MINIYHMSFISFKFICVFPNYYGCIALNVKMTTSSREINNHAGDEKYEKEWAVTRWQHTSFGFSPLPSGWNSRVPLYEELVRERRRFSPDPHVHCSDNASAIQYWAMWWMSLAYLVALFFDIRLVLVLNPHRVDQSVSHNV